ncbi:MAG TPA: 2-C-methyl-D-erythritol 4-phosphate cytidylyltransferase [Gemmatimonadales bacterium]|nr:2-C-methyl-D-erythritol 4-phosphate cytidylyltransferase [Gemmatimonadales bacterium]
MPRDVGVIIVAAGQGNRLGGSTPKQFQPIAGVPMLLRAIRPFASHPEVGGVVVVLAPDTAATPPGWLAELSGPALKLVAGGAERSDSAMAGLEALDAACTVVLVHDAARPFVDRAIIDAVIAGAREGKGAIPAVPVGDTLKAAAAPKDGGLIRQTVPRAGLWRAQTPQGFPRGVLERAYAAARSRREVATDDAALVEAIGETVTLVPGSERNIKVTTALDLELSEQLARGQS